MVTKVTYVTYAVNAFVTTRCEKILPMEIPNQEQMRRFVAVIETMAADSGVSVASLCEVLKINSKVVSQRKGQYRGKRGLPLSDVQKLKKAGVDTSVFEVRKLNDVRPYLPDTPLKVRSGRRNTSREIDELREEIAELKRICALIAKKLKIESDEIEAVR